MKCATCSFVAPSDFAFCPHCGTSLEGAGPPAEQAPRGTQQGSGPGSSGSIQPTDLRGDTGSTATDRRLVTVLFADVSGFTDLSERLDPEVVRAFQGEFFGVLSSVIQSYGGWVEKYVGDAVLAVFGAPVAHENDTERALHAALTMHEDMNHLSQRWRSKLGGEVVLHIGVNTGLVVAGHLGEAEDGEYVVTGDTVNTTARLEGAARAGQTLVSAATHQLTQSAFGFESLDPITLKGKTEPQPVYALLGRLDADRAVRGLESHGLVSTTVGRETEVDEVWQALQRSRGGSAQIVAVVGEAGVGKSRVMEGFLSRLHSERLNEVTVRWLTCGSLGEQTYGVWAAYFRKTYDIDPDNGLEAVRSKLEAGLAAAGASSQEIARISLIIGYLLGLEPGVAHHLKPQQLQRQINSAIRTLMEVRLRHGPLVLVVEDFHFVDTASVDLLRAMMDRLHDQRILLVVDFRPSFDPAALVGGRASYTTVRVGRLSSDDCDAILDAFFGETVQGVPQDVRRLIIERAGGLPFYLEEIVRSLIDEGTLVHGPDGWECPKGVNAIAGLPGSVRSLLAARLDRLSPSARRHVQVASVLGAEFRADLLAAVSGEPCWEQSLDTLVEVELVEEVPLTPGSESEGSGDRRYRFAHGMIRDVAYKSLLRSRRSEIHGRAAEALGAFRGARQEQLRLEELVAVGHHFRLSSQGQQAARYFMEAGEWTAAIYANDDAVRYFREALKSLEGCDGCDERRAPPLERLGDLLSTVGKKVEAGRHYEEAFEIVRRQERISDQARLLRKRGRLRLEAGDRVGASALLQEGLDVLGPHPESMETALLLEEMGRLAFRNGDHVRAARWAEKALRAAEAVLGGESVVGSGGHLEEKIAMAVSHARNTLGISLARTGRLEEAVRHIEDSVSIAEEHDLQGAACRGLANLGVLYSSLDPPRAVETCRTGMEAAKRIGDLGLESSLQANLAVAYCALTDRCEDEGLEAAEAAIVIDRELGQMDHLAVPLIVLGQIHQCRGDLAIARDYYREALSVAEEISEPQLLFPCYEGLATIALDQGDMGQAEEHMKNGQRICEEIGLEPEALLLLPFLQ